MSRIEVEVDVSQRVSRAYQQANLQANEVSIYVGT
jgi:hypothetical protein